MDTRTGIIHEMQQGETLEQLAQRLGGAASDFVEVKRQPVECRRCGGTGRVRAGLNSRRFKPCRCVL